MKKTIITTALTGGWGGKEININKPITPEEIATDAIKCHKAGAAIVHLHMKKDDGIAPSMSLSKFIKTKELIQKECDLIINMTTSGEINKHDDCNVFGSFLTDDKLRTSVITSKPDMASFDIGTMNFNGAVFLNPISFLKDMGKKMISAKVKPEIECFDIGHIDMAKYFIKKGILQKPVHFQLVLGVAGGAAATVDNLVYMVRQIPEGCTWSAFGLGESHIPIMLTTIALDGQLRVGLEDNLYFSKGVLASNESLTKRAADFIELSGKTVATPNEAREMLSINHT